MAINQFLCSYFADLQRANPFQTKDHINKTNANMDEDSGVKPDKFIHIQYHKRISFARTLEADRINLMRIGIFDPYLDDMGGGEKYMVTLAECLSRRNLVTVFWNNEQDLKNVAKRFSLDISKVTVRENIFSPKVPFFKRYLESLKYDAIVVLSDGSIPFTLSRKLFVHFQQPVLNVRLSLKTKLKKLRVTSFFCNSYFTKSFIDKKFQINSLVLYPPVNIAIKKTNKENIILHVGRFRVIDGGLNDYKKQNVMINVFKKMIDNGLKNWKFVLAIGLNDRDKSKFNELEKEKGDYPIEFLVNINKDDLSKLYLKSKIYWHASGYGENLDKYPDRAEHFGISTVEAMMGGCVPVVFNAGGQREIVENNKSGYLWITLEDFVSKTDALIKDEKLWKEVSGSAIKRSAVFSVDRFYSDSKNIIK